MEKIYIYGLGNNYIKNAAWLEQNYIICGLIDSAEKMHGKKIGQYIVTDVSVFSDAEYDKVVVTPNAQYEITKILLEKGVPKDKICYLNELRNIDNIGRQLKICFYLIGGMGDGLIGLNYVWHFRQKYGNESMQFYLEVDIARQSVRNFVQEDGFIQNIEITTDGKGHPEKYDLYIKLVRYPEIVKADKSKIAHFSPEMIDYILICEKFRIFHPRFIDRDFIPDGGSALLEEIWGKTRILQPDVYGVLGIDEEYRYPITVDERQLEKFYLKKEYDFITIHRGCEKQYYSENATKLWPVNYYNELINRIKESYPTVTVILLGAEYEKECEIFGMDMDLRGKTNMEDLKALLKYSMIHIDGEGGNVHLRHALHGGSSVVFFGPTSNQFFGYSENKNLRSSVCPYPCEWIVSDWAEHCMLSTYKKKCMEFLTPEIVFDNIKNMLGILKELPDRKVAGNDI